MLTVTGQPVHLALHARRAPARRVHVRGAGTARTTARPSARCSTTRYGGSRPGRRARPRGERRAARDHRDRAPTTRTASRSAPRRSTSSPFSWHHVALTRADDRIAIYVDGVLRARGVRDADRVRPERVRRRGRRPGRQLRAAGWAAIDEIAFYDRPLDAATIEAHARAGDDGAPPVARADPPVAGLQSPTGIIHLETGKAGASFRCSLDGAASAPCRPDYSLAKVSDGVARAARARDEPHRRGSGRADRAALRGRRHRAGHAHGRCGSRRATTGARS